MTNVNVILPALVRAGNMGMDVMALLARKISSKERGGKAVSNKNAHLGNSNHQIKLESFDFIKLSQDIKVLLFLKQKIMKLI